MRSENTRTIDFERLQCIQTVRNGFNIGRLVRLTLPYCKPIKIKVIKKKN